MRLKIKHPHGPGIKWGRQVAKPRPEPRKERVEKDRLIAEFLKTRGATKLEANFARFY